MAILFVTHKFPPSIGGMQKQSYELINGIRKQMKVYTIAIRPSENKLWFFLRLKARIKKMLNKYPDITIIHCNDGVIASCCTWLNQYPHVQLTATLHGLDIVFPNMLYQNYIVPKLHKFAKIFCVSQATANECIKRGFASSRVQVIHNGVDAKLAQIPKDKKFVEKCIDTYNIDLDKQKVILAVGRAVKRKGFSWFTTQVLPNIEDACLIMVGPAVNTKSLKHKLMSILPKGIKKQIELLTGYPSDCEAINKAISHTNQAIHLSDVSHEDLMQLYTHADVFIMPNIKVSGDMEGFGLVALEAVLRNCPVIVSDIEGIKDAIINNKNGIRLPSAKPLIWTEQLNLLLSNYRERQVQTEQAIEYTLNNYSWEKMSSEYSQAFNKLETIPYSLGVKEMAVA